MFAQSLDNAVYCKGCGPWEETLKFEILNENQKINVGSDDNYCIKCEFNLPRLTSYEHFGVQLLLLYTVNIVCTIIARPNQVGHTHIYRWQTDHGCKSFPATN